MKPFSFFILALCFSLTFGQNYNIIRQSANVDNGEEYDQPDLVQIPSSLCPNNGTSECPLMNATRYLVCRCTCDITNDFNLFYKSTFGFYDGSWKCEKNSALRRHSGCQLSLDTKNLDYPILTVQTTIGSYTIHRISNVTTTNYLKVPANGTCSIIAEKSMFLTCFGEWRSLDTTLVTKRFHVNYTENWPVKNVVLQVSYEESSTYPLPSGRIIKLAVTCSNRPWEPSQCILLKIEGRLECPVSPPHPATQPAQPPAMHPTYRPSTTPSTSPSRKSGGNVAPPKKGSSMAFHTGVIIGISLSGLAVLAALVMLVLFTIRLRKRRFIDNDTRNASTTELVAENETYGERVVGAKKPTHQMEKQVDPEGKRLTMQEEPVYALPGPTTHESNSQQDEPFYHVLEEPKPYGTQEYEMHEGLQSDKAPNVYGTFDETHQTSSSDYDPSGYINTLYDSVGDMNKQSK